MSECKSEFFITNEGIKSSEYFNESLIVNQKSVYEVIRVIKGEPLFLEQHLKRLDNSKRLSNMNISIDENEVKENIYKLIDANKISEGNMRLIFTEGKFEFYFIEHHYPSEEDYKSGVKTIFYFAERNNPNAKIINKDLRKNVDPKLKEENAYEAILVDRNGMITEGSKSNIFLVMGNELYTAPVATVLPGVTRTVIMELCKNNSIKVKEENVNYKDIDKFDGLFISGTSPKVLPVSFVESFKFDSSNNVLLKKVKKIYDDYIDSYIAEKKKLNRK